jgi:hypothetical protein
MRAPPLALALFVASCNAAPALIASGASLYQGAASRQPDRPSAPPPEEFIAPPSPGVCRERAEAFRGRRAYLLAMHDRDGAVRNEVEKQRAWEQCRSDYESQKEAEAAAARTRELEAQIKMARLEEENRRRVEEQAERDRQRMAIANAVPVEAPPEPVPPPPPAPPAPRKVSAAERMRAEERRMAREQREHDAAVAELEEAARVCGPAPERSKWDGIYVGLARAYKTVAHDPDSIEFVGCTDAELRSHPACWVFSCDVRGKNMFGARILSTVKFKRNAQGWFTR